MRTFTPFSNVGLGHNQKILKLQTQLDAKQALVFEIEHLKGNLKVLKHMEKGGYGNYEKGGGYTTIIKRKGRRVWIFRCNEPNSSREGRQKQ